MQLKRRILIVSIVILMPFLALAQTEVLKGVVNNLAFYNQKRDLKYLSSAKKVVDSLITTHADSSNLEKTVFRAVVYSSILYTDSLNKLNQPADFLEKTTLLADKLLSNKRNYKFRIEISYVSRCLANVYIRNGFERMHNSDFVTALKLFTKAQSYVPSFKTLNAYIAFANSKLGNLQDAANYYDHLLSNDTTRAEYVETTASIYNLIGDTLKALQIIKKGRSYMPQDKNLVQEEANIYNNKKEYKSLQPLLGQLLDMNPNNADVAFVAANCYDHLNEYDKAESLYLLSIELNSAVYEPVFNLGLLYLKEYSTKQKSYSQDMARALRWLEKANDMSPNDINCLEVLKIAYSNFGDESQMNKIETKLKMLTNQ